VRRNRVRRPPLPRPRALRRWARKARAAGPAVTAALLGARAGLRPGALAAFARTAKAPVTPTGPARGPYLAPSPRALGALVRSWDKIGVTLPRLARGLRGGWDFPPLRGVGLGSKVQGLAITLAASTSSVVLGWWRLNPGLGQDNPEVVTGGILVAQSVYKADGGLALTRCAAAPLFMAHICLWPAPGAYVAAHDPQQHTPALPQRPRSRRQKRAVWRIHVGP
jgi:hypothetical protein